MGRSALDLQRGGMAVLDSGGNVIWTDEAWAAYDGDRGAQIGTNLLESYRGYSDPIAQAIANAIVAVFEGKATYFEIEHRGSARTNTLLSRRWRRGRDPQVRRYERTA